MIVSVGFSYRKGFAPGSSLLRAYMGRPFSHTYLKVKFNNFEDFSVLQSTGDGVSILSYSNFCEKNFVVTEFALDVSKPLFWKICNEFHRLAGTKYGFAQNIGILAFDLGLCDRNPFKHGINCSEWVALALQEIWPDSSSAFDVDVVRPDQIFDFLKAKT